MLLRRPRRHTKATAIFLAFATATTVLAGIDLASAATSGSYSLLASKDTSVAKADSEVANLELGLKFKSSTSGQLTAVRFLKASGDVNQHTVSVWDNATGTRLSTAVSANETASGWQ